jgi:hypothetical protein
MVSLPPFSQPSIHLFVPLIHPLSHLSWTTRLVPILWSIIPLPACGRRPSPALTKQFQTQWSTFLALGLSPQLDHGALVLRIEASPTAILSPEQPGRSDFTWSRDTGDDGLQLKRLSYGGPCKGAGAPSTVGGWSWAVARDERHEPDYLFLPLPTWRGVCYTRLMKPGAQIN